jgi:hypothetical protein
MLAKYCPLSAKAHSAVALAAISSSLNEARGNTKFSLPHSRRISAVYQHCQIVKSIPHVTGWWLNSDDSFLSFKARKFDDIDHAYSIFPMEIPSNIRKRVRKC